MFPRRGKKTTDTLAIQQQLELLAQADAPSTVEYAGFVIEQDDEIIEGTLEMSEARLKDVHQIEKDMLEVRDMINDLAYLVKEQQPILNNIENALVSTTKSTEKAQKELEDVKDGWCKIL